MNARAVGLRLRRRGHIQREWTSHLDEQDSKALRQELTDAIVACGEHPEDDRPIFVLEFRDFMGSWQSFGPGS